MPYIALKRIKDTTSPNAVVTATAIVASSFQTRTDLIWKKLSHSMFLFHGPAALIVLSEGIKENTDKTRLFGREEACQLQKCRFAKNQHFASAYKNFDTPLKFFQNPELGPKSSHDSLFARGMSCC